MRARLVGLLISIVAMQAALPVARAADERQPLTAKQRQAEKKALTAFTAGRYEEALAIYADLFVEYRDAIYLRNIARCHHRLGDTEKAIASYEDYLMKYKRMSALEEDEVKGFIRELREKLGKDQPAPAESTAPVAVAAPPPPPPPVLTPAPPPVAPALQAEDSAGPANGRAQALQYAGYGALGLSAASLVTGVVLMTTSWSKFNDADGACAARGGCNDAADGVSARNLWSKIFLVTGVVAGAAGGTLLYLAPRTHASGSEVAGVDVAARWRF